MLTKGECIKVVSELREHEGFRREPYDDMVGDGGNWTVGYGTLLPLTDAEAGIVCAARGEDYDYFTSGERDSELFPIDEREGMLLLRHRFEFVLKELEARLQADYGIDTSSLPSGPRMALARMAYNLGVPRLFSFRGMLAAYQRRDWASAHAEALHSQWARQLAKRAEKIAWAFMHTDDKFCTSV